MTIQAIRLETAAKTEVINVTEQLAALIGGVVNGTVLFYTPHTTAALIICEDDDELRADLVRAAELMYRPLQPFQHTRNNNPNPEAHLLSAFAGTQLLLPILDGKLDLGRYQNVLFIELDGPKTREIRCHII